MIALRCVVLALAFAVAVACPLAADVLHVGPHGTGAAYVDLQAAVNAAAPGDTVRVAPGTYRRIVIDKPLQVLGSGSGSCLIQVDPGMPGTGAAVRIQNVNVGEVVVAGFELSGMLAQFRDWSAWLEVDHCSAPVVLQDLRADQGANAIPAAHPRAGASVVYSPAVHMFGCFWAGHHNLSCDIGSYALLVVASGVWLEESACIGGNASVGRCEQDDANGSAAIYAIQSSLALSRSHVLGGKGGSYDDGLFSDPLYTNGSPGLYLLESDLYLLGGDGNLVEGGPGHLKSSSTTPTFKSNGGPAVLLFGFSAFDTPQFWHSPDSVFESGPGKNPTPDLSGGTFSEHPLAQRALLMAASAVIVAPGQLLGITLDGEPTTLCQVAIATRLGLPNGIAVVLEETLVPSAAVVVQQGVLDPSGHVHLNFSVPADPALSGTWLFAQARRPIGLGGGAEQHTNLVAVYIE